ncbi:NAD(P)-dependent oxidoreductase [Stenotrophomonas sp. HITSZ_GD]|uniref:NAD(P)-dependent oxidoreductase n=1 Tax=Stenotrophomonas sp. HITSZ_GD TaxID=3037248 RepID=UPI00240E1ED0|nr:NAD(P)-dependent oxidoreductase [Stenotrophomonas sp. HITSZ_GD]MDG2523837.1 NAD(P)-dependent oxidoreductase [Stenotrophomonas sp. HITSZ_GD]
MAIGFLGLGSMGAAMAANLLRGGHPLRVWNRDAAKADALARAHAQATPVARAAQAAHGQVLFSMLADDNAARQVLIEGGVIDALPAGSVHVNMATISVALARELTVLHAERGVAYLAVPVLGRPDVAARGQLNLLAAGDALALARVQPLLDLLGQRTWTFGSEPAQANAAKLAANLCIASAIGTMAEGAALVRGHGVEPAQWLELLWSTLFAAPVYQGYGRLMAERRYQPAGFTSVLGRKDVDLAIQAAQAQRVPVPLAEVLRAELDDAIAGGQGDCDWAVLAEVAARRAGQG